MVMVFYSIVDTLAKWREKHKIVRLGMVLDGGGGGGGKYIETHKGPSINHVRT